MDAVTVNLEKVKDNVTDIARLALFDMKPFNYPMEIPSPTLKLCGSDDASNARKKAS